MSRWHRKSCRKPEVQLVGGLPFCERCECMPGESLEPQSSLAALTQVIPPASTPGNLHLSWPSSVSYYDNEKASATSSAGGQPTDSDMGVTSASNAAPSPSLIKDNRLTDTGLLQPNQVRLLTLSSGSKSDPLHGSLSVSMLHNVPEYEALSYTWADSQGNSARSEVIYLGEHWDIVPITANCERALRAVRYIDESRTLWVDSVCIDQNDLPERSHQVSLMRQIYTEAWRVLVYVGESSHDSHLAMKLIGQIDDNYKPTKEDEKSSIANLFNRRYFNRTWIIQEVALARSLVFYCGDSSVFFPPYAALRSTVEFATDTQVAPPWMRHCQTNEKLGPRDLVHLVLQSQTCQCADPRDRIFALLGLLISPDSEGFVADYSLPVEHVYIGLAAHALQRRALSRGEILQLAAHTEPEYPQLPSWVPSWGKSSVERYSAMAEFKIITNSKQKEHSKAELSPVEDELWNGAVHTLDGGLTIKGLLIHDFQNDILSVADNSSTNTNEKQEVETSTVPQQLMECTVDNDNFSVTFHGLGEARRPLDNIASGASFCLFLLDGISTPVLLERTDTPDQFRLLSAGKVFISSPSLDYKPGSVASEDEISFDDKKGEEKVTPIPVLFDSPLYRREDAQKLCDYPLELGSISKSEEAFLMDWEKRLSELFPPLSDADQAHMGYWKRAENWRILRSLLSNSWRDAYREEKALWDKCSIPKEYLIGIAKDKGRLQILVDEVRQRNGEPGWLWEHKRVFNETESVEIWNIDKIICLLLPGTTDTSEEGAVVVGESAADQTGLEAHDPIAVDKGSSAANPKPTRLAGDDKTLREFLEAGQAILDLLMRMYSARNDPDVLIDLTHAAPGTKLYRSASDTWSHYLRRADGVYKRPPGFFDFSGWFAVDMLKHLMGLSQSLPDPAEMEESVELHTDNSLLKTELWSWEEMERQMTERMDTWTQLERMAKELEEATVALDLQVLMHKVISQTVLDPFKIDLGAKQTITIL